VYAKLQPMNQFISYCAFGLLFWQIFFVLNFFGSIWFGKRVGRNPWKACSLEWEAPSPPGHGNFDRELVVHHGPYEYGVPGAPDDFVPQTHKLPVGVTIH
jgi:cytochrome c oxidase subunit 1